MAVKVFIQSITLSDGTEKKFDENSINLIVGPNNSGKSILLKEIYHHLGSGEDFKDRKVGKKISLIKEGEEPEIVRYVEDNTEKVFQGGVHQYKAYQLSVPYRHIINSWSRKDRLDALLPLFCISANTEARLAICNPPHPINVLTEHPTHPIHVLKIDEEIEKRFSRYCQAAFKKDLIVNHGAGNMIPLHFGDRPTFKENEDRVSKTYINKLKDIPLVNTQGDGIKSFIGCLLATLTEKRTITLIDEPEAFLHPPQAYLLGKLLAREHKEGQKFIATHSSNLLRGVLDSDSNRLNIFRITRKGNINSLVHLNPETIRILWSDPFLRFSNLLDGVFHEGIVICEDEADCKFYSSVLNTLIEEIEKKSFSEDENASKDQKYIPKVPDLLFISSGGKSRIPKIVESLKGLDIPIRAIADFDIFSNEYEIKNTYESLGGKWKNISKDYNVLKGGIERDTPPLKRNQVIQKIRDEMDSLESSQGNDFPEKIKKNIKSIMKSTSPWYKVKKAGEKDLPSGDPTNSYRKINQKCQENGLWIVPCGELESFDKTISGEGSQWLAQALEKDILKDTDLLEAKKFIQGLMQSFVSEEINWDFLN